MHSPAPLPPPFCCLSVPGPQPSCSQALDSEPRHLQSAHPSSPSLGPLPSRPEASRSALQPLWPPPPQARRRQRRLCLRRPGQRCSALPRRSQAGHGRSLPPFPCSPRPSPHRSAPLPSRPTLLSPCTCRRAVPPLPQHPQPATRPPRSAMLSARCRPRSPRACSRPRAQLAPQCPPSFPVPLALPSSPYPRPPCPHPRTHEHTCTAPHTHVPQAPPPCTASWRPCSWWRASCSSSRRTRWDSMTCQGRKRRVQRHGSLSWPLGDACAACLGRV